MAVDQKRDVELVEESPHDDVKIQTTTSSRIDPEAQASLLRKLDYRVMPVFFIMYFLNHCKFDSSYFVSYTHGQSGDRNGLPQARLDDIEKHLGLVGNQYNVCISILYVGYLLAGIPSNMLLTRIRPSIYLGVCMCGWAIVSACTSLAHNYHTMLILRFLLGFLEAPFYPGAIYILSRFYTRREVCLLKTHCTGLQITNCCQR